MNETIKVEYAHRVVREFINEFGVDALPFKIMEILDTDKALSHMSQKDRVLCGLRYSEYLTDDTSTDGLWRAEQFKVHLTARFKISRFKLREQLEEMGYF